MNNTSNDAMKGTILVEFFATWCPHCQRMMPIVAQVEQLLQGQAKVVQLDIDKYQKEAQEAGVDGIPTFIVYVDGEEKWRHSGEIDGEVLLQKVQSYCK